GQLGGYSEVRTGHIGPSAAIPMQNQRPNPATAACDDIPNRPRIYARGSRDREQVVVVPGARRVRARHLLPPGAVPVQNEGSVARSWPPGVIADRPGIVRRYHPHAVQLTEPTPRAWAADGLPRSAVPVFDQGLVGGTVVACANCPDAGRRRGADAIEEVVAAAGIRAVHLDPRRAIPVLGQGLERPPAQVKAHRPGIAW